jgi:hypothetical protein
MHHTDLEEPRPYPEGIVDTSLASVEPDDDLDPEADDQNIPGPDDDSDNW